MERFGKQVAHIRLSAVILGPMKRLVLVAAATAIAMTAFPAVGSATTLKRTVAQGFLGVDMDPWDSGDMRDANISTQLDRAAAAGVESIRFPLYWFKIQKYSSMARVPSSESANYTADPNDAAAAPYRWTELDYFIGEAAKRGIRVMPSIMGAPLWADDETYTYDPTGTHGSASSPLRMNIPNNFDQYGAFVATLARRYGSSGSFWTGNPSIAKIPVVNWQIWNEPDFSYYWPQHADQCVSTKNKTPHTCPADSRTHVEVSATLLKKAGEVKQYWAPTFVSLLSATRPKVKAVDPAAKIVLASLTNAGWIDLNFVYLAGGKGLFDAMGANIFVATANTAKAVSYYRAALKTAKDPNLPMIVTEFSWSSAITNMPISSAFCPHAVALPADPTQCKMKTIVTDEAGQSKNLGTAVDSYAKMISSGHIIGLYWYSWASKNSGTDSIWDYSGLNSVNGSTVTAKPALATFTSRAMKLEGCKTKLVATACATK